MKNMEEAEKGFAGSVALQSNISIGAAGAAAVQTNVASDGSIEWTLPSGKSAKMRKGTGRDVLRVSRLVTNPQAEGTLALMIAGVSVKTLIDGKAVTYEDVQDLDEDDVWDLIGKGQSMGKGSSLPTTSPS